MWFRELKATLVLMNGRCMVPFNLMVIDTATIPTALIERVDVVISQAYGSDAVAGAVNLFLKRTKKLPWNILHHKRVIVTARKIILIFYRRFKAEDRGNISFCPG
jgi:outer membrane cobalamin receptor